MPEFYMIICPKKINKMPQFYMIFAENFLPNLEGEASAPPAPPVSYAYDGFQMFGRSFVQSNDINKEQITQHYDWQTSDCRR